VWFVSLPLKADYVLLGLFRSNPFPVPIGAKPSSVATMLLFGPTISNYNYIQLALLFCIIYSSSVLFCGFWPLIWLGPWWLRVIGRLGALGILAVWVEVAYASQHYNFLALPGYPVLAIGSTLICLGVWLIPSRQKRNEINTRNQTVEPNAGSASGTRDR
jgi:hypothetical protein